MNTENLTKILQNYPKYRLKQAGDAIFKNLIADWDEAKNLPADIREFLKKECPLDISAKVEESKNGSSFKAIITLADNNVIETVLIKHRGGRNTVCVSSQIGCALACGFCATGKLGFKRNLSAEEIIMQVLFWNRFLKKMGERASSVVFMGMGEPFLNYGEVMGAIRIFNDAEKFNIGARHISISTSGIIPGIKKLAEEDIQINLAISLHAPNNKIRSELMPINKKYALEKVLSSVSDYIARTNRKVMIEYALFAGINDSAENAKELAEILKKYLKKLYFVNLIPCNKTEKYSPPQKEKIGDFLHILEESGITVAQRASFGGDIGGACGQLAGRRK